jgi:hypothetical protein
MFSFAKLPSTASTWQRPQRAQLARRLQYRGAHGEMPALARRAEDDQCGFGHGVI